MTALVSLVPAERSARHGAPVLGDSTRVEKFTRERAKLNSEQRCAVESIEGVVLVIAGPGTGKTEVLALRVANILRRTQMRPGNILCLTFSQSGTAAMRERLRSLIGPDAYGVAVDTFHGFCGSVIAQNPLVFSRWSQELECASDVERTRIVNTIIDQLLPHLELVNPKEPHRRTREILERISLVKREGKSVGDLHSAADLWEKGITAKEGTKARTHALRSVVQFRDFITIFERYEDALARAQRYDYDDVLLRVIDALREEEWLLASLQERFQYVLVDEFQDLNGAQHELLRLLTTYATVDHVPNLFVVGDDDQAIYRFQGATLQGILNLRERFPSAPVIALTESYRCSQPILSAAAHLIAQNTERLVGRMPGLAKDLRAASPVRNSPPPTLVRCGSDIHEPWVIADIIEDRIARNVSPEEIAVLVQRNSDLVPIADALAARGIPVSLEGKRDLLAEPPVREAIAILSALPHMCESSVCAAAIGCSCFRCHPADLGRLYQLRRERECTLLAVLLDLDVPGTAAAALPLADRAAIIRARDILLDCSNKVHSRTVVQTLERVLRESGLLCPGDPLCLSSLQAFFQYVKSRAHEQPQYALEELLADLVLMANPEYVHLRLQFVPPRTAERGVRLLTAHQSKGLEFSVVILSSFRDRNWGNRRNLSGIAFPEELLFGWEKAQRAFERGQDERRVAYVAMTRARDELILVCPETIVSGEKPRPATPSAFASEAGELPEERRDPRDPAQCSLLLAPPPCDLDAAFRAFLMERVKQFTLSVTALNSFLEDPQVFLQRHLLQVPQAKEASLAYGTAVHSALHAWGVVQMRGDTLSLEDFVAAFERHLLEREILTKIQQKALLRLGREALPAYYDARLAGSAAHIHRVEHAISVHLGDIPIKGLIDRIDLHHPDGSDATVIDFKTGRPKTEAEIRSGDLFRQLTFYAVLLKHGQPMLRPKQFILDFIGERGEAPIERVFDVTAQETRAMENLIRAVWSKIIALDFTPL